MIVPKLKPAYTTLEGQGWLSALIIGFTVLLQVTGVFGELLGQPGDLDKALAAAKSASELAEILKTQQSALPEMIRLGETGSVLFFLYKLITFFTSKRIDLKKFYQEEVLKCVEK